MDFKTMKTSQEKHRWNKFFISQQKNESKGPKKHIRCQWQNGCDACVRSDKKRLLPSSIR
jgi:hypothetical protein